MPLTGIARLLGREIIEPETTAPPRAEIYLRRDDADACLERALGEGATLISAMSARDWGDVAAYVRDPDGHIVALARA
jgi:uncharacterized glyoxalase superfamily protein PhnB